MSVSRARPSWGHVPGIRPHQGNVCVGDPTKCHHVMQAMYRGFEFDDVCKTYESEIVPGKRSGTWTLSLCCERRLRTQTLKFKPECLKAQSLQHKYWFSTVHDCVTRSLCSRATRAIRYAWRPTKSDARTPRYSRSLDAPAAGLLAVEQQCPSDRDHRHQQRHRPERCQAAYRAGPHSLPRVPHRRGGSSGGHSRRWRRANGLRSV